MQRFYVYGLYDPRDGSLRYIGQTIDLDGRLRQHLDLTNLDGNLEKATWVSELAEQNLSPEMRMLAECSSPMEADDAETKFIHKARERGEPILNKAPGGRSRSPSKFSQTTEAEWIELGYKIKTTNALLGEAICQLSGMMRKNSREVRQLEQARVNVGRVRTELDRLVAREYPSWDDVMGVFYGPVEGHVDRFRAELQPPTQRKDPPNRTSEHG